MKLEAPDGEVYDLDKLLYAFRGNLWDIWTATYWRDPDTGKYYFFDVVPVEVTEEEVKESGEWE